MSYNFTCNVNMIRVPVPSRSSSKLGRSMCQMNDNDYKEVYFHEYCEKCKHKELPVIDTPCEECLDNPINLYSHKPVRFEEDT